MIINLFIMVLNFKDPIVINFIYNLYNTLKTYMPLLSQGKLNILDDVMILHAFIENLEISE